MKSKFSSAPLSILWQFSVLSILVLFASPTKAEFNGSEPVEIRSEIIDELRLIKSIEDGNDGTWIAWLEDSGRSIGVRRINKDGKIIVAVSQIAVSTRPIEGLDLAIDKSDSTLLYLTWTDKQVSGALGQPNLFVEKISQPSPNIGISAHWIKEISASKPGAKERPDLIIAKGDPIVVWTDFRSGTPDIYATRLNNIDGSVVWGDLAVTTLIGNQDNITLATGSGGNDLFVGFSEEDNGQRVRVHKVKVVGGNLEGPVGGRIINTPFGSEIAGNLKLLSDHSNAGFYAAWSQGLNSQAQNIYLAHLDSGLNFVSPNIIKVTATGAPNTVLARNKGDFKMDTDGNGNVFLTWINRLNNLDEIYATKVNSLLQKVWGSTDVKIANIDSSSIASTPSILSDALGGAYVAYSQKTTGGAVGVRDIRVAHIAANTFSTPANGFPNVQAAVISNKLDENSVSLVSTDKGIIVNYSGMSLSGIRPYKIHSQVFSGSISASRIQTPVAESFKYDGRSVKLTASAFVFEGSDTHKRSEIEIKRVSGTGRSTSLLNFPGIAVEFTATEADSSFVDGETFTWRVRYISGRDQISAWSETNSFVYFPPPLAPTITALVDQQIDLTTSLTELSQAFTIANPDPGGDISDITVTATSSDQTRVADADIVISGSGANRNITVQPKTGGDVTITVKVSTQVFINNVTVVSTNVAAYKISSTSAAFIDGALNDINIDFSQTKVATLSLNIIDDDAPNLDGVTLAVGISDTRVIPLSGFIINPPSSINAPTIINITAATLGVADITLTVTDRNGHITTKTFKIIVSDGSVATTPTTTTSSEDSGGGAMGLIFLLMFFGLAFFQSLAKPKRGLT